MDERERRDIMTAAFGGFPTLLAVTGTDGGSLVALNDEARRVIGDHPVGTLLVDVFGPEAGDDCRAAGRTGRVSRHRSWRVRGPSSRHPRVVDVSLTPVRTADGAVRAVVVAGEPPAVPGTRAEESVVETLQDAFLPKGLPGPPGVAIAARYLLGDEATQAGGDWFDAVALDDGRVVLSVGDVVGHGVGSSTVMGVLRAVFDDRVRDTGDLGYALEALDRYAQRTPAAQAATVTAAVLEPRSGELTYCTAGHPPPVVVRGDGVASYLPRTGSSPLGVPGEGYVTVTADVRPGDIVLFYSDGLVERPGRTVAQNAVELLHVVQEVLASLQARTDTQELLVDALCRRTLELLTSSGYDDDITLMAVQRCDTVEPLAITLPAVPDSVRAIRLDLSTWLAAVRASALDELVVQHAVGELVSNAVEHAYDAPGLDAQVRVSAVQRPDGTLEVEVADDGRWRSPRSNDGRGRGLAMVRGLVDDLRVERDGAGTRARIRQAASRPAGMLRGVSTEPRRAPAARGCTIRVDDLVLRVAGDVDSEGAELLDRVIARSSHGGTRAVRVDLTEVGKLGSAGVRVLVDGGRSGELRLTAPVGSPAQHVLDVVGVSYES